ncbi:S41 family peptidase [Aureibaculum conchae]|uniref:S41 family peptidase n=1 Tax=Aureibaculum sp. 2308TA14-22 TaxID=3108392 RepID=UPI00339307BD
MKRIVTLLMLVTCITLNAQIKNTKHIEGTWKNDGYGRVIEIKKKKTKIYDICKINCIKSQVISNEALLNEYKIVKTSDSTLVAQNGISKYHFSKIEKLPYLCSAKSSNSKDPIYNFEVLWQTFKENYCYFEERDIDWDALKTRYKPQITSQTKPFELFLLMDEMIMGLKDGHSNMFVPNKLAKKYEKYRVAKQKIRAKRIKDSLGQDFKLMPIHVDSTRLKVIGNYVKDIKTYNYGVLNYGLINDDVAIIQINGMDQFANYNIPNNISESKAEKLYENNAAKSKNYTQDNADGAAYIMDQVILEIKDTKACILDIRFNGGGYDEVQLEILERFATKDTLAATKKARNSTGFTKKTPITIKPSKNAYKGKVFFLTSYQTASAAEDFVLCAMAARPDAIRIGSNTEGIFSDLLNKKLPNGWEYSLSNEVYESPDGMSYEAIGISPHHKIEYDKRGYWFYRHFYENKTGKDAAIEKVFEILKQRKI